MNHQRRDTLKAGSGLGVFGLLVAAGMIKPELAQAAWNKRPLIISGPCSAETEEQVLATAGNLLEPFLDRLQDCRLNEQQRVLVDILRANLKELTAPFASAFASKMARLTPAEMQVANLIKLGKRSKEIAEILHLSPGTVNVHRKNIRKKLDIDHQKANLQTLLTMQD